MKPGHIYAATHCLGAPANWDEKKDGPCGKLDVRPRGDDGTFESVWYPTQNEIELLAVGHPVILTIWSASHPPVSLNVFDEKGHTP